MTDKDVERAREWHITEGNCLCNCHDGEQVQECTYCLRLIKQLAAYAAQERREAEERNEMQCPSFSPVSNVQCRLKWGHYCKHETEPATDGGTVSWGGSVPRQESDAVTESLRKLLSAAEEQIARLNTKNLVIRALLRSDERQVALAEKIGAALAAQPTEGEGK